MTQTIRNAVVLASIAAGLSACGGDGGSATAPTAPVVTPAGQVEDQIGGTVFGTAFRVGANTDPADPAATAISALSLTTDPVTL